MRCWKKHHLQFIKKKDGPIIEKREATKVCIDDFALKKRYRYGTVMIDIETRKIVDMIDSREAADVTAWLKTFPNIKVVSRDGSASYAGAISEAHPEAIQVSDRFHLLKNLTDAAKRHITWLLNPRFLIKSPSPTDAGTENRYFTKEPANVDKPTKNHRKNTEKKALAVAKVRELRDNGYSYSAIERETGISYQTIKKYLSQDFNLRHGLYGASMGSKLKPYTGEIKRMLKEGKTFKVIEGTLRLQGYSGAASTIRMYATRERRLIKEAVTVAGAAGAGPVERKWVVKLLYHPLEQVKEISGEQLQCIFHEYPVINQIYDTVKSFKEILCSKKTADLDSWVQEARLLRLSEIESFINGICKDIDAVKNAIKYEYNNGLAEGSVNKVKVIKRIMYGRCGFDLLKNKTLKRESQKSIN